MRPLMTGKAWAAVAMLAALAAGAAWWLLIRDHGSAETAAAARPHAAPLSQPPAQTTPTRETPAKKQSDAANAREAHEGAKPQEPLSPQARSAFFALPLPRHGQPIVWLRPHRSIAVHGSPGGRTVKRLDWKTQFGSRTVLAVFDRRGNWAGVPTPLLPNGHLGWVKLDPLVLRAGWTTYSIDVDLSATTARLLIGHRVVRTFRVTVGAPGSTTPVGRFAITDTFRGNLNPAYGCCALATTATQPSLPSGWLGGNRIAIHGTYGPVGVAASHGCIRAANPDVNALVNRVPLGTPVLVHE